jgi:hypothetical protein
LSSKQGGYKKRRDSEMSMNDISATVSVNLTLNEDKTDIVIEVSCFILIFDLEAER